MIQRKLLVIAGFVFIASACSPLFDRTLPGEIIVITATSTPTPTLVNPIASEMPGSGLIPITAGSYFILTTGANCYNGPGIAYAVVLILQAGENVAVIGRNQESTWWRVSKDASVICWVANESGTFFGEASSIPITSSQYATEESNPISPTQTKQKQVGEPTQSVFVTQSPQPTNPLPTATQVRPTNPTPTASQVPATNPPTATQVPATNPPTATKPPTKTHPAPTHRPSPTAYP